MNLTYLRQALRELADYGDLQAFYDGLSSDFLADIKAHLVDPGAGTAYLQDCVAHLSEDVTFLIGLAQIDGLRPGFPAPSLSKAKAERLHEALAFAAEGAHCNQHPPGTPHSKRLDCDACGTLAVLIDVDDSLEVARLRRDVEGLASCLTRAMLLGISAGDARFFGTYGLGLGVLQEEAQKLSATERAAIVDRLAAGGQPQ